MSALFRATKTADFDRLYRQHAASVYRYAFAVLGNRADAEDVAQQTFLKAYSAIAQGTKPRKAENWLVTIAHNEVRRHLRNGQARALEVELDERLEQPEPERTEPSLADVLRALQHLPPAQRSALVMREFEGRSYAEMAQILGVSQSALESLIFRARRSLAEHFEEALTCAEAEQAVSRRLDGRLSRREARRLKKHLRECPPCARFVNVQKRQRSLFESLSVMPVPASLFLFRSEQAAAAGLGVTTGAAAGGSAAVGGGVAAGFVAKAAAVAAAASVAGGVGYGATHHQAVKADRAKAGVVSVTAPKPRLRPVALTTPTRTRTTRRKQAVPTNAPALHKPKPKKAKVLPRTKRVAAGLVRAAPQKSPRLVKKLRVAKLPRVVKTRPPTPPTAKSAATPAGKRPQVGKKIGLSRPERTKPSRPADVAKPPKPKPQPKTEPAPASADAGHGSKR
jgi:RNA polymerase sigma-70 factor, ECF subfamily